MEISSFYICVLKIMIRWCMIPEIWCVMDVTIFHFGPFFCPLTARKIKILKKLKEPWRYHHFTYVYQKLWSDDVQILRYGSWQMYNYFSFWATFCPFTPLAIQTINILKKWKNAWKYHHFTYVYQKLWLDDVRWFLRYGTWQM